MILVKIIIITHQYNFIKRYKLIVINDDKWTTKSRRNGRLAAMSDSAYSHAPWGELTVLGAGEVKWSEGNIAACCCSHWPPLVEPHCVIIQNQNRCDYVLKKKHCIYRKLIVWVREGVFVSPFSGIPTFIFGDSIHLLFSEKSNWEAEKTFIHNF